MTKLKLSGLYLVVFFSVSLVLFNYPFNKDLPTNELTQKIAADSNIPNSNPTLSLVPNRKNTTAKVSSVYDIYYESNNMAEGIFRLDNVASQQLCNLKEYDCSSSQEELHRLISIIESSTDNELLLSQVKKLWYMAADLGAPETAISALRYLTQYADENIADLAARALNDLVRLNERNAIQMADGVSENTFFNSYQESANITGEGLTADVYTIKNLEAQNIREIQELRMTGLNEHQPEKRILAVKNLSRYREVEVIDALIEATYDVDNLVRHDAVNALWIVGGDNKNNPGIRQVLSVLDRATMDTDPEVAGLATKALEDLLRKEEINTSETDLFTTSTAVDNLDVTGISSFH